MSREVLLPPPDAALAPIDNVQAGLRRSVRRYTDQRVSRAAIEQLLAAAISAPSAHNRQPWRFAVMESSDKKAALACAMGQRLRADRARDGDPHETIAADVQRSYARITGAGAIIVVCLTMQDMDTYPDEARSWFEHQMAVQSTAMAGGNLLLAAHAMGLGACWLCAPLFCPDTVSGVLNLPTHWQPQGMITLGHPAEQGKPFQRRSIHDITLYVD